MEKLKKQNKFNKVEKDGIYIISFIKIDEQKYPQDIKIIT